MWVTTRLNLQGRRYEVLLYFCITSMKEDTSAHLSGGVNFMGGLGL